MYLYSDLGTHYVSYTLLFLNIGHKIVQNYIIIFLKLFGEKRFVNSVKVFSANIKSINPIQKYPYIIESYASCFYSKNICFYR